MIESDHKVNYELAYAGACARGDAIQAAYDKLLKAARRVLDAQNKYERNDALDALEAALPRVINLKEMG